MRSIVVVASKHGSTREIGREIARSLNDAKIPTDVMEIDDPIDLLQYDAVILGSAVYMAKWLPEARKFVDEHADKLSVRPLWLFSSGPLGDPPKGTVDLAFVAELMDRTGARGHQLFAGSLDPDDLAIKERLVTKVVHAPSGDFRDWPAIREWASSIAEALVGASAPV